MRESIPLREITLEELWSDIQKVRSELQNHNHLTSGSQALDGVVTGILQSSDFVSGVSGWRLRDGVLFAVNVALSGSMTISNPEDINTSDLTNDSGWTDDSALNTFVSDVYTGDIAGLQSQIDGNITTWFYAYVPSLINIPASDWTTDSLKNDHLGDLFYDTSSGYAYRFQLVATVYSWQQLSDSDIQAALEVASNAQDTADHKRTVFTVEPTTPYNVGDLWLTSLTASTGDIKKCITEKLTGAYEAAHWVIATDYTEGADWSVNLSNIPGTLATPSGTGLFLGSEYMGYYDNPNWITFIKNDGTFQFRGDDDNYVSWNGVVLGVKGNVIITGGSGIASFDDAGDLVTINEEDIDQTNLINAAAAGATVGADWGVDLSNIPATLGTPSPDGLYLSSTHLGYYKDETWTSFIQSNGNFYFAGDDDSSIDWNITTAATLTIKGKIQAGTGSVIDGTYLSDGTVSSGKTSIVIQGWTHNLVFSATDNDTVAWAGGTINLSDGSTTYSIDAGNTGAMTAINYIYLDTDTSETALQTTTTYSTAIGDNKILIAVAENVAADKKATFQVYGGIGGIGTLLTTDNLAANCITANLVGTNEIIANAANIKNAIISNAKIADLAVDKLTTGSFTSKAITLAVSAGTGDSKIQAGKTDFTNDDSGFILGIDDSDSDKTKFFIGDSINYLNWDGTSLLNYGIPQIGHYHLTGSQNDGMTETVTGSASISRDLIFSRLRTQTTDNSTAKLETSASTTTSFNDLTTFRGKICFSVTIGELFQGNNNNTFAFAGIVRAGANMSTSGVADTTQHIGFYIRQRSALVPEVLATNANGTTQTTTSIGGVSSPSTIFRFEKRSADEIRFYRNDVLVATHTTNIYHSLTYGYSIEFSIGNNDSSGDSWLNIGNNYQIVVL